MHRREFLIGVTAGGITASALKLQPREAEQAVKRVYVVTKCHLDIGFTDTERNVLLTYFNEYLPRAMSLADTLRRAGGEERYV